MEEYIGLKRVNNMVLIVVRQEVSNFDSSVVVHELELANNRALYGCLCSLGNLSWSTLPLTANLVAL